VLPRHGAVTLLSVGTFKMNTGVDLLLVALLQVLSYPFHDPVLTDRGFITREKTMLRAFVWAGVLGFLAIFAFSLVGVHAKLEGLTVTDNAPAVVAKSLGVTAFFAMTVIMITAAGSTIDSTFAAVSKSVGRELPLLAGKDLGKRAIGVGMASMVAIAVLGNLPMIAGTDILKATTLSGTMVMGLAPVFLLQRFVGHSPLSFHLSFWSGIALGIALTVGWIPKSWALGDGKYALLLGTNLYGLALCSALFLLPTLFVRRTAARAATDSA
jgi:hypothetical protein